MKFPKQSLTFFCTLAVFSFAYAEPSAATQKLLNELKSFSDTTPALSTPSSSTKVKKEPTVFYWPATQRTPAKIKEHWLSFDGGRIVSRQLLFPAAKVDVGETAPFVFSADTTRWNATFVLEENPRVRWGIAYFTKKDWLPSATNEVLEGYMRGLTNKGYTLTDNSIEIPELAAIIRGVATKAVFYTTPDGLKHADNFFETKGLIWSVGFEAPQAAFDTYYEKALTNWARLNIQ